VAAELDQPVEVESELVARRHLPSEARHEALDQVVVHRLVRQIRHERGVGRRERHRRIERVGERLVDAPVTHRSEEPEAVGLDRSARGDVQVVNLLERVACLQPLVDQLLRQRFRLQRLAGGREEHVAAQGVAAVLRNHVQPHAAAGRLRRDAAGLIAHLGEHALVEVLLDRAVAFDPVQANAVHHDVVVFRIAAMRREVGLLHPLRAADVRLRLRHADERRAD
jgi:hypothetical protein